MAHKKRTPRIGTSDCAYSLGVNESTGEVQFWVSPNADGSGLAAGTADAPRGVWVHLTAVYDTSASLTLYQPVEKRRLTGMVI